MKGVLNFHGEARQFYFHSVHMLLEAKPGKRWQSTEARQSRFVFIGRHLDSTVLHSDFSLRDNNVSHPFPSLSINRSVS